MKKTFVFILTCSMMVIPGLARSIAQNPVETVEDVSEELIMYVGDVKSLPVRGPSRIAVGKPTVADVTEVTESRITVTAKSAGTTTLVLWDNFGEQDLRVRVFAQNMQETQSRIDKLLAQLGVPGVKTQISLEESKVMLLGSVKKPQDRERIISALATFKNDIMDMILVKEEETIVDIDVQVLELDKDATKTLGFTFPGSVTLSDASGPVSTAVTGLKNVFHVSDFTRTAFDVTLDALVQEGKARVLSRPRLACQSGKEAELLVGGEKPVLTSQNVYGSGQSTQVEYKEYGIKLKIKPSVSLEERRIKLGLNVEVSDVGTADFLGSANAPTAKAYPLTKRNISTELALNEGQTLAIGGLTRQRLEEDIRRTPFLSDVPVLGSIFRKKTTRIGGGQGERGDMQLFIMLTPTIVNLEDGTRASSQPAKEVAAPEAQPAPAPQPAVPAVEKNPVENYKSVVQKKITDNLTYPVSARQAGFQGTVKLKLRLSYTGELLESKISASSGYKVIDDNTLSVAKSVGTYPPFPPAIEQKEIWLEIPVVYKLD